MANVTIKTVLKDSYKNFAAEAIRRFADKASFNTVSGKVDTLIGSDTSKSVRTIANEELAAQLIPSNAQEALDTLQEISAWIQSHPAEASAINSKLTLGTYDDNGTATQYATVKAYVEAYVASQLSSAALSGSDAVQISNNVISLIIDTANANGISIGNAGLKMAQAGASTTGALTSTDWNTFNAKQEQIAFGTPTGAGNVITSVSLNNDGKTIDYVKGINALVESDFEAISASEITTLFNQAQAIVDAESSSSSEGE